jgi:transposase
VERTSSFLAATSVLDTSQLTDQELIQTYKEQHCVERGFSFLKDPLFLASSVFVKKPSRIVVLGLVMVLCLLVYRLAEHRLRSQLAATGQMVLNQLKQPSDRPTIRWMFQCFEGIDLLYITHPDGTRTTQTLRLDMLHRLVLQLLGPAYDDCYLASEHTAE